MRRRFTCALAVLLVCEVMYFGYHHRDVVRLNRSREALLSDAAFADDARMALRRERVSRRVLERVADASGGRSDFDLQLRALDRIAELWPTDPGVQLRRADLLRSLGRLAEAERIYQAQLASGKP